MAITRSMTRYQSHDGASSKKKYKICDNGDVIPWSDLNHHVLSLVMMKLAIVDFDAFSGVCKSWRSLALSEKNMFMVSKPPLALEISYNNKECYFKDFEGRMSKLNIPHLSNLKLIGVTCGYLILFGSRTLDLYLVNPITTHELHFHTDESAVTKTLTVAREPRVILVFSTSLSRWVVVVLGRDTGEIWFSVAGKGTWNNVSSTFDIRDVFACKGEIYTLYDKTCRLCELRLHPEPKLILLETKNVPEPKLILIEDITVLLLLNKSRGLTLGFMTKTSDMPTRSMVENARSYIMAFGTSPINV